MYARIVGDVVAKVGHGRRVNRRDPDGTNAEPLEIVEPLDYALQVTDAITIAVLERSRIYLVNNAFLPPQVVCMFYFHAGWAKKNVP